MNDHGLLLPLPVHAGIELLVQLQRPIQSKVAALWVIAGMANNHPIGDFFAGQKHRNAVRALQFRPSVKRATTAAAFGSHPRPAMIISANVNFAPEISGSFSG
jgi:hypothetical protein